MSGDLRRGAPGGPEERGGVGWDGADDAREAAGGGRDLRLGRGGSARRGALARPRLLALGVVGLCLLGGAGAFAPQLTASLRGALPARIAGGEGEGGSGVRVATYQGERMAAAEAVRPSGAPRVEAVSEGDADYLPKGGDATAGTVITVSAGQGRLLRFDEAVESVFIADPAIADIRVVAADLVYVYGKSLGLTNLMAVSARPTGQEGKTRQQLTASALLRVVVDPRPANDTRREWAPSAPVDISVFGRRTAVSGQVANVDEAVDAANVAETYSPKDQPPLNKTTLEGPNQINIRVRFAEASRNDLRSLGINWDVKSSNFNFSKVNVSDAAQSGKGLKLGGKIGSVDVDVLIDALQASGAINLLAEPNLTAVTGETASFLAGGEVPIPVPTGNGNNSIAVQFKQFGVSLAFTPTIVRENRIAMRVKPEVSSVASFTDFGVQGFSLPSFTVRRAETTIELASGQTFAMAGLFQRDVTRNVDKMPVLGDVPVLGALFRSERYQRNETELVILITPYLVEPVSDKSLATPLDRAGPATWQADIVPDATAKGATLTETRRQPGFIMK